MFRALSMFMIGGFTFALFIKNPGLANDVKKIGLKAAKQLNQSIKDNSEEKKGEEDEDE